MSRLANIDRVLVAVAEHPGPIRDHAELEVSGCATDEIVAHIETLHVEGMVAVKRTIRTFDGTTLLGITVTTKGLDRARRLSSTSKRNKMMSVFLIWSGDDSRAFAKVLHGWLPTALPFVDPWMSEDITKGARQDAAMEQKLADTSYGIVCITPGVQHAPWPNFEAGAISKVVEGDSYVSPVLLGVSQEDMRGLPLDRFQCTTISKKSELSKLLRSINRAGGEPIPSEKLRQNLDNLWPTLEQRVNEIVQALPSGSSNTGDVQPDSGVESARLHAIEEAILVILSDDRRYKAQYIAPLVKKSITRTKHHLDVLLERKLVHDFLVVGHPKSYRLNAKGRAYLVKNDLIP